MRFSPLPAALAGVLLITSCTAGGPAAGPSSSATQAAPSSSAEQPAPEPATSWGPLESDVAAAAEAVAEMSLEEKVGQVFVDYYSGSDPAAELQTAKELHLGGVILMGDNIPTTSGGSASGSGDAGAAVGGASGVDTEALAGMTERFQDVLSRGRDWPGIVSVDQEGGLVARVQAPLAEWPAPMAYGAAGDTQLTARAQEAMNAELAGLGFNMNFAPDADVTIGPADPVIGARSYGSSPDAVADQAVAAVSGALDAGVLPAVKHFPGHGSVTTDSHVGLPVQDASVAELEARDWVPFAEAARNGVPMVMMGHIAVAELDPGVPSSLSAANYEALRGLGFEGVAVTDGMNMAAVEQAAPGGRASVEALAAGADLILMPTAIRPAHAAVVEAVESGEVPESRLDEAATRVVAMMMWQGRLAEEAGAVGGSGAARTAASTAAEELARASVTVVDGECAAPLVSGSFRVAGGTARDRARLAAAAEDAGLEVGSGPLVTLLGTGSAGRGDIVVSLDAPWGLARATAPTAKIALYGRTTESFEALVDVLAGEAEAPGKLPVSVGGYEAGTGC